MIDKESLIFCLETGYPLSKYFSSDALVFNDSDSIEIYRMFTNGINEIEIFKKFKDDYKGTTKKTDGEVKTTC